MGQSKVDMRWVILLLSVVWASEETWDGKDSNYGDIHKAAEHFKEETHASTSKEDDTYVFFSLHDYNQDGHLDGHELRNAFLGVEFNEDKDVVVDIPLADLESYIDHTLSEVNGLM